MNMVWVWLTVYFLYVVDDDRTDNTLLVLDYASSDLHPNQQRPET